MIFGREGARNLSLSLVLIFLHPQIVMHLPFHRIPVLIWVLESISHLPMPKRSPGASGDLITFNARNFPKFGLN